MLKPISNGEKTRNIHTRIVEASPLISYVVEYGGGECDCVNFLTTSSQLALQAVLSHTHDKPNTDKAAAKELLEQAQKAHQEHFLDTVRDDVDTHTTRHRLIHTRNRVTAEQPVQKPVNYIKKSLGKNTLPPTVITPNTERRFQNILDTLPIEAQKISDTVLERLMLLPDGFDAYCGVAKDIYRHANWKKIAHILGAGKTVYRGKHLGRSSRIMQVQTLSGEKRYAIFANRDTLHTHTTPSKTSQHKIQKTSFRVFENYDDLLRSQEHALSSLQEKIAAYTEWQLVLQDCHLGDQEDFQTLIGDALEYFSQRSGYYPLLITRYLEKGLEKSAFISHAIRNIHRALQDMRGKLGEIELVYQNLAKGREKIIMEEVRQTAQLINR